MEEVSFRSYEQGDEAGVLDLFREVFRGERGEARWRWQFQEPSPGRPLIALAVAGEAVLGHFGIMRQDWSFQGRRIPAGLCCDAMVRERLRGRGIFSRLGQLDLVLATESGCEGLMAFSSRNTWPSSYAPAVRHLGMARVGNLRGYHLRTGIRGARLPALEGLPRAVLRAGRSLAQLVARRRTGRPLSITVTEQVPEDIEDCLARHRAYEVLCVWKDVAYLQWRYQRHPEHRYLFHVLRSAGAVEGLAVTRRDGRTLVVCDLIHRRKDVIESAILLREIALRLDGAEDALGVQFCGLDNGFFEAAFLAAGFAPLAFTPIIMLARGLHDRLAGVAGVPYNWSVAYADTDVI